MAQHVSSSPITPRPVGRFLAYALCYAGLYYASKAAWCAIRNESLEPGTLGRSIGLGAMFAVVYPLILGLVARSQNDRDGTADEERSQRRGTPSAESESVTTP